MNGERKKRTDRVAQYACSNKRTMKREVGRRID